MENNVENAILVIGFMIVVAFISLELLFLVSAAILTGCLYIEIYRVAVAMLNEKPFTLQG